MTSVTHDVTTEPLSTHNNITHPNLTMPERGAGGDDAVAARRSKERHVASGVLDASAFPHILERIIAFADHNTLLVLRGTSRQAYDAAEARLFAHVVLKIPYDTSVADEYNELHWTTLDGHRLPGFPVRTEADFAAQVQRGAVPRAVGALARVRVLDLHRVPESLVAALPTTLQVPIVRSLDMVGQVRGLAHTLVVFPAAGSTSFFGPTTRRVVHCITSDSWPTKYLLRDNGAVSGSGPPLGPVSYTERSSGAARREEVFVFGPRRPRCWNTQGDEVWGCSTIGIELGEVLRTGSSVTLVGYACGAHSLAEAYLVDEVRAWLAGRVGRWTTAVTDDPLSDEDAHMLARSIVLVSRVQWEAGLGEGEAALFAVPPEWDDT